LGFHFRRGLGLTADLCQEFKILAPLLFVFVFVVSELGPWIEEHFIFQTGRDAQSAIRKSRATRSELKFAPKQRVACHRQVCCDNCKCAKARSSIKNRFRSL